MVLASSFHVKCLTLGKSGGLSRQLYFIQTQSSTSAHIHNCREEVGNLVKQLPQEVLSDLLTAREAEVRRRNAKLLQTVEMLALQLRRERERHRRLVAKVAVQRQSVSDARNTVAAMQSLISANSSLSH